MQDLYAICKEMQAIYLRGLAIENAPGLLQALMEECHEAIRLLPDSRKAWNADTSCNQQVSPEAMKAFGEHVLQVANKGKTMSHTELLSSFNSEEPSASFMLGEATGKELMSEYADIGLFLFAVAIHSGFSYEQLFDAMLAKLKRNANRPDHPIVRSNKHSAICDALANVETPEDLENFMENPWD